MREARDLETVKERERGEGEKRLKEYTHSREIRREREGE